MSAIAIERKAAESPGLAVAASATIAGSLLQVVLGFPLAPLQATVPIPAWILGLNAASHLLLFVGIVGLARSGAAGRDRLGPVGLALAGFGLVVLTLAEVVALFNLDAATPVYAVAMLAIAVGLILAGVAVVRAGQWVGWRRWVTLACGLAVPLVVVPAFALPGYAPHYAIGAWGVCWLLVGLSLRGPAVFKSDGPYSVGAAS